MKPLQIFDLMAPKTTARLRNVAPKANAVTLSFWGRGGKKAYLCVRHSIGLVVSLHNGKRGRVKSLDAPNLWLYHHI